MRQPEVTEFDMAMVRSKGIAESKRLSLSAHLEITNVWSNISRNEPELR